MMYRWWCEGGGANSAATLSETDENEVKSEDGEVVSTDVAVLAKKFNMG